MINIVLAYPFATYIIWLAD